MPGCLVTRSYDRCWEMIGDLHEGHRRPLLDVVLTMDCLMTGVVGRLALEIFTGRYRSPCCLFEFRFILC